MVTVRQKVRGKNRPWYVFIHLNGIIRSKRIGTRREAEAVAVQLRRKLVLGELKLNDGGEVDNRVPEFSAYAETYLENHAKILLKRNTVQGYRVIIDKHLNPSLRGKLLNEVRRRDIKNLLLQKQREGLAAGTIENIKALASGIFSSAMDDEIIPANPVSRLGKFIPKSDPRRNMRFATPEQVIHMLQITQEHHPDFYPFMLCAFRTGMRLGELLGLAWSDVDFDNFRINISRSLSHGHFSSTKSHKTRHVEMSNQLKQTLQAHRESVLRRFGGELPLTIVPAEINGGPQLSLVFVSRTGGPLNGDNLRHRVHYDIAKRAKMEKFRFHDIRHTFCSLLLKMNTPVVVVRDQMGHASITTTCDVYGHVMPDESRTAINRLDGLESSPEDDAPHLAG